MDSPRPQNFPPAFYARFHVERLTPEQTDELLENGWFRHHSYVGAFAIKHLNKTLRSVVSLRLPLENFTWKKRLLKLMRRNEALFSVRIQPCQLTEEQDLLWQKFKHTVHGWQQVAAFGKHLTADFPAENFGAWQIEIRHEGKLVAFSAFDLGRRSLASLEAAYDPDFSKFSLGLWTMLLEIDFALRRGLAFFYPGFLPKNLPMFDYKLRPGGMEFFRWQEKRWLPLDQISPKDWMLERVGERLESLLRALVMVNLDARYVYGRYYFKPGGSGIAPEASNFFLFIANPETPNGDWHFLAIWVVKAERYLLFFANVGKRLASFASVSIAPVLHLYGVGERQFLGEFQTGEEVVRLVNVAR